MRYETIMDIGARKRQRNGINEDSIATAALDFGHRDTFRSAHVFVIADGAGGHAAGDVASYIATNRVIEELSPSIVSTLRQHPDDVGVSTDTNTDTDTDTNTDSDTAATVGDTDSVTDQRETLQAALEDAVLAAHRNILEFAVEAKTNPATTVVAAVCVDSTLHFAWVGDSRLYVINRNHEQISLLTRDHSIVERRRQAGEISDVEATVHREGNRITRALGGSRYEDPETSTVDIEYGAVPLYSDDIIMLTSDGLIDAYTDAPQLHQQYLDATDKEPVIDEILDKAVTDDEIRDIALSVHSLESACDSLVELANERGGKDNISIVLADEPTSQETPDTLPPRGIDEEPADIGTLQTVLQDDADPENT